MFSKNIKSIFIIVTLIMFSLGSVVLNAECDMMAMLTKSGYIMPDITNGSNSFDYPDEIFQFLKNNSSWNTNDDGYGVIYYKDGETIVPATQRFHQVGIGTSYSTDPQQMDDAEDAVGNPNNDAIIVLGHARSTTQGAYGNHPFWFEVGNDNTYTFQHNGDCDDLREGMMNYLDDKYGEQWFINHPSNWGASNNNYSDWIDSELLFHFIMSHILEYEGDVVGGIIAALNYNGEFGDFASFFHDEYDDYKINFVLSDGEALYAFRNNPGANLSYKSFNDEFVAVKTDIVIQNGQNISQYSLVEIPRNGEIVTYEDIFDLDAKLFTSGVTWSSYPRLTQQYTFNGDSYEQVYWNPLLQTPGLLQLTSGGDPTIDEFKRIDGKRNEEMYIRYVNNIFEDHLFDNKLFRHEGYKIEVAVGADPTVLIVDGDRLPLDHVIAGSMTPGEYHWLGFWLPQTQNMIESFGDFWQYVAKVQSEEWFYSPAIMQRGGNPLYPVAISAEGLTLEYGKTYLVLFNEEVDDFYWTDSGATEEPEKKAEPENFTYTEKADYEAIDVFNIPPSVTEIGVFEDEVCVGAVVVEDTCAQILVYSDSANRDPIPFTFEIVTGRGFSTPIKDYLVLNQMTGEFESSVIISGRQGYSSIKLGEQEEPENIVARPILLGNYPNPFNPTTKISFSLPSEEDIVLTIYNIKGQKVKTLYSGTADKGEHTVIWEGKDTNNKLVSSGIYFYKLKTNNEELTRKMLMMK
ncbi:MAG: T9SS type A sorting domain-containing protein [Candidatus Cloacimonetes bacterium]|jgi:hypothetical protein|nr:T9SS type A sorting domain-containing protein [Candidatus Cloacimonadota bacterium]